MAIPEAGLRIAVVQTMLLLFLLTVAHFLGWEQRAAHFGGMMKKLLLVVEGLFADDLGEGVLLVPEGLWFFDFGHDGDGVGDEAQVIVHYNDMIIASWVIYIRCPSVCAGSGRLGTSRVCS